MLSTATQTKQYCKRPAHNHLLMVHIESDELILTDSSPEGLCIDATFIHAISGEPVRDAVLYLEPDRRVYFVASSCEHWYYIVLWSNYFSRFGCSCLSGKQYAQTHEPCEHMRLVAAEVM